MEIKKEENEKSIYEPSFDENLIRKFGNPTKIFALGGIEEIGKNMYVFEQDEEIFIIDCGVKFSDSSLMGINGIICPFNYLVENESKIKGLIITHGHEDHIGGVPYLLLQVNIPKIYASRLSIEMVKKKCKEFKDLKKTDLTIVDDNTIIQTKRFKIEFFRVCHSIPDAFGIYLETVNAKIIESGDFKFDFSTKGDETDILKIAEFGRRDIDLLMCESTNAQTEGFGPSEKNVIEELEHVLKQCPGRVFLATFASNLQRIEELIEVAVNQNRKICMLGRSMNANVNIATDIGLLNVAKSEFIQTREINNYPDEEVFILCTGSQGEELAALNQLVLGKNVWIALKHSDTIVFSSNPIPGNFENVEILINNLINKGVNVKINSKETQLHTSGHAAKIEHQLLFKLVNPQYIIPIHGEYKMMLALCESAIESGIHKDNVFQVTNGQIVEILNHQLITTNNYIEIFDVYVDGNKIDSASTSVLKFRRALSHDGIFNITLSIDFKNRRLLSLPVIATRGSFFAAACQPLIYKIAYSIQDKVNGYLRNTEVVNKHFLRKTITDTAQYYIWSNKRKKPLIKTTFFDVSDLNS